MNRSNFVAECQDEARFSRLLPLISAASLSDFDRRIDFVNLVGLLSTVENSDT
jgi:hypothetical protein